MHLNTILHSPTKQDWDEWRTKPVKRLPKFVWFLIMITLAPFVVGVEIACKLGDKLKITKGTMVNRGAGC